MEKDEISKGLRSDDLADSCELEANVEGTCDENGAKLTQRCSHAVHGRIDFQLEDTRRRLISLRNKHGADSPAGHRCSNIIEQLQNMRDAEGDQRGHLVRALERQMQELANLTASH